MMSISLEPCEIMRILTLASAKAPKSFADDPTRAFILRPTTAISAIGSGTRIESGAMACLISERIS